MLPPNYFPQFPGCNGYETGVQSCQWGRRRMGSGVCDHHPNLGLRCQPFHHPESKSAQGHWRGLKFESAPYRKDLTAENTQYVSASKSVLRHVEISGAGRGRFKGRANATSAVESWGVPPVMDYILIENSAYNGDFILIFLVLKHLLITSTITFWSFAGFQMHLRLF